MTCNEFVALCLANTVDPDIALDNKNIAKALFERNDTKIKQILKEEF